MRTEFLCISVLRIASGPRVKLASCKSVLNPRWFALPTVLRRWSGVSLLLCCVNVYSTRRFVVCLSVCHFILVFFSPFSIATRELILVLFVHLFGLCLFRFVGVLFLLGSGKGCGL